MEGNTTNDSNKEMNELLLGTQKAKLRDRILLSPYTKFLLPSLLVAFFVPVTVYAFMISPYITDTSYSATTCNLKLEYYVDCLPGRNSTEDECTKALCCWSSSLERCYHTVPAQHGYTPDGGVYYDGAVLVPRETSSPLGSPNVEKVYLDIAAVDDNHVKITLSTSSQDSRIKRRGLKSYLYPSNGLKSEEVLGEEDELTQKLLYFLPRNRRRRTVEIELEGSSGLNAYVHYPEVSVTLARDDFTLDGGSSIFSTARGPLILTETYWEWTFYATNGSLYGLNDIEVNGTTNWIYNNENGTITPAFLSIGPSGDGAAYYVDYKGPLEVQVVNTSNLVILRGMSLPENLVVHVFSGPTPLEAVRQLTLAMSSASETPSVLTSWRNYGLHVCPNENFTSVEESIAELNQAMETLGSVLAPWDSHCLHERLAPVLNHVLSTKDLETLAVAKSVLEETGRSFLPHLTPMVLAENGALYLGLEESKLLLTNGSTSYLGTYQNSSVAYPDWENTEVNTMAGTYLVDYLNDTGSPESLWLRDAWPKDEKNSSYGWEVDFTLFDYMPETLEYAMSTLTVPYNLLTSTGGSHHATHNRYSQRFRSFVRSSIETIEFLGPPGEGGNTSWSGLRSAVRSAVGAGLVGQLPPPIYVCGTSQFDTSIHDELCIRWYQAAVTWPQIIVLPDRMPGGIYPSKSASLAAAQSLRFRSSLTTYQHTITVNFYQRGSPILAPTSLYFPEDATLTHTWTQFMWGEAILVGLVTLPGVSQVSMRLPGNIPWRHLMGGSEVIPVTNGTVPVTANLGQLITLVRPGYIVPIHKDLGNTTSGIISSNVTLAVNLYCKDEGIEGNCSASGEIYYGSKNTGEYLNIEINGNHLILSNLEKVTSYACDNNSTGQATFVQSVQLLGNSSYEVNTELCDLEGNSVVISLV